MGYKNNHRVKEKYTKENKTCKLKKVEVPKFVRDPLMRKSSPFGRKIKL